MEDNELVERVRVMEERYNEARRALSALERAVEDYGKVMGDLSELDRYMTSGLWQEDFEADEAGKIPPEVGRGVLSEDGLYNLLQDAEGILSSTLKALGGKTLSK